MDTPDWHPISYKEPGIISVFKAVDSSRREAASRRVTNGRGKSTDRAWRPVSLFLDVDKEMLFTVTLDLTRRDAPENPSVLPQTTTAAHPGRQYVPAVLRTVESFGTASNENAVAELSQFSAKFDEHFHAREVINQVMDWQDRIPQASMGWFDDLHNRPFPPIVADPTPDVGGTAEADTDTASPSLPDPRDALDTIFNDSMDSFGEKQLLERPSLIFVTGLNLGNTPWSSLPIFDQREMNYVDLESFEHVLGFINSRSGGPRRSFYHCSDGEKFY